MQEIGTLKKEVQQLREKVSRLEHKIEQLAKAVTIDADGVTDGLMAGIIEGDVTITSGSKQKNPLKPKEREFLRVLV